MLEAFFFFFITVSIHKNPGVIFLYLTISAAQDFPLKL